MSLTVSVGMTQPSSAQTNAPVAEAIDDCGLRFLLASRHHVYLLNTLPLRQRAQMQQLGLSAAYYVWAFHSEAQDELLSSLPSMQKGAPTWAEMRQFGVGWWLRNINSLQRCAEKVFDFSVTFSDWFPLCSGMQSTRCTVNSSLANIGIVTKRCCTCRFITTKH